MSDLSRMWFRLTGSGGSTTTEEGDDLPNQSPVPSTINVTLNPEQNNNNNNNNNNESSSKFDRFRRGSFRRKSSSMGQSSKRSKSPHFILKPQISTSLEEADEMEEKKILPATQAEKEDQKPNVALNSKGDKMKVQEMKKEKTKQKDKKLTKKTKKDKEKLKEKEEVYNIIPHSDSLTKCNNKKTSLKSLKNAETQKKKFYKNFYNNKTNSQDSEEAGGEVGLKNKTDLPTIFPLNSSNINISALADDDDDDEDDDDDDDDEEDDDDDEDSNSDSDLSDSCHDFSPASTPDNLPRQGKEKIFLTDRKFRNNRIEKSSSKTKVAGDLEKRESIKRSRSSRKIPTASAIMAAAEEKNKQQQKKSKNDAKDSKKQGRAHSNLNLQALVKFVMNNKKFLNTDDFNLIRRKSISEAASAVIQVAATCKPMPIALKYPPEAVVADAPKENDIKGERNVVLVKKQNLNNSFCDRLLNNNNNTQNNNLNTLNVDALKPPVKERKNSPKTTVTTNSLNSNSAKVKRNSSNSSKSSGNFEDEAFYSCDERDEDELDYAQENQKTQQQQIVEPKRKSSSPSLTSRVAAKINETTNNYKNRKAASKNAKKRKTLAASAVAGVESNNEGPEYYKQLNVGKIYGAKENCIWMINSL